MNRLNIVENMNFHLSQPCQQSFKNKKAIPINAYIYRHCSPVMDFRYWMILSISIVIKYTFDVFSISLILNYKEIGIISIIPLLHCTSFIDNHDFYLHIFYLNKAVFSIDSNYVQHAQTLKHPSTSVTMLLCIIFDNIVWFKQPFTCMYRHNY